MSGIRRKAGEKFGKITLLGYVKPVKKWHCVCDCGEEGMYILNNLTRGNTKQCVSCANISRSIKRTRHGMTGSVIYSTRTQMIMRCTNPKNSHYKYYGGRGIRVCDRWLESFENFYADMGEKPTKKHQLDRIDNDGNYSPENCRWVTLHEQAANRSNVFNLTIDGVTKTVLQWAKESEVGYGTILNRLKAGVIPKQAVFAPALSGRPMAKI